MDKEEIQKIIDELNEKQSETGTIEVKSAHEGKPEKYYDTISSFSNTMGGVILFGVKEVRDKNVSTFEIVGVNNVSDLVKNISNLCCTAMEPAVRPVISIENFDGKRVVAVKVDMLDKIRRPCYYKKKGIYDGSYYRIGDRDDHMSENEINQYIASRDNHHDDLRPVTRATIDDLDQNMLDEFIVKYTAEKPNFKEYERTSILLQAGVLTQFDGQIYPTVAGIMVFGINPQSFYPQWFVAAIVIPGFDGDALGQSGERFLDNQRIEGNIQMMFNQTINFLNRNMKIAAKINPKTALREDIPQYPTDAIREAISNMLLHRDYSEYKRGAYSKVTVFRDRIEFRNVGNLYGNNTLENIKSVQSVSEVRNETIVNLIEIMGGIIENRHTGIRTMYKEMNKANLPEPVFNNEPYEFVTIFYNGEYPELYPKELASKMDLSAKKTIDESKKTPDEVKKTIDKLKNTPDEVKKTIDELKNTPDEMKKTIDELKNTPDEVKKTIDELKNTPYEAKNILSKKERMIRDILDFCQESKTINEIMFKFGYNTKKTLLSNYIKPLVETGRLKMSLPDKPTSRNQKYVTNKDLEN